MTERQRSEGSGADEDVLAGDARAHCREAAYLNYRFERDAPPKSRLRAPQAKRSANQGWMVWRQSV